MESMGGVWSTLSIQKRMVVFMAAAGIFAAVLFLARGASNQDMSLLFGGLDGRAAGDVITALDQQSIAYEVRGTAIYVPTVQRDVLRMNLAGQGLPATGSQGYELLDSLSGFSTTSQMFDAAYWRAKEGELARTIVASPHVRGARVHISTPSNRAFQRDQTQSAAVTVTTANGALSGQHVKALQFLVSAAVPRLQPNDVAIIDDDGGLLSDGDAQNSGEDSAELAAILREKAERLLAARVGPGNAVVEVSVETVTETEQVTERRVDPDSRIAISTDVTESTGTATDSRNGSVTVASNLPDGDANSANGASSNENSESRTLTNFEVSETERQLIRGPGAVKRLTVAVLINQTATPGENAGQSNAGRSDEELEALRELVGSAVGLDPSRGDVLTLKSMVFEPNVVPETPLISAPNGQPLDLMQIFQITILAVVALILGLFVVRPILLPKQNAALPAPEGDGSDAIEIAPPMAMAIGDGGMGDFMGGDFGELESGGDDAVGRLRTMIADRRPETLQVLQDWIEDPKATERST